MLRTFNMGIGLILACDAARSSACMKALKAAGEAGAVRIGEIRAGTGTVVYA